MKNSTETTNYTSDGRGNIKGGFGELREYSFSNMATENFNSDSELYKYYYNENNERIKKENTVTGEIEYYLRDYLGRELIIYDYKTSKPKEAIIHGVGKVGKIKVVNNTDNRYYYLSDHLGSVRTVMNSSGAVTTAQDYYPYGELLRSLNPEGDRYKYNGKEYDFENGTHMYGARNQNPNGFWLQVDPLAHLLPALSPYNYVQNNPINRIDPHGLTDEGDDEQSRFDELFDWLSLGGEGFSINWLSLYNSIVGNDNQTIINQTSNSSSSTSISPSINPFLIAGFLNTTASIATGAGEYSNVSHGYWLGTNGKPHPLSWGGNQWTSSRTSVLSRAGAFRIAGRGFFALGVGISGIQGYTAFTQGDYLGAMKSGLDITMGAVATFGGPPGMVAGGFYFMTTYGGIVPRSPLQSYFVPDNTNVTTLSRIP